MKTTKETTYCQMCGTELGATGDTQDFCSACCYAMDEQLKQNELDEFFETGVKKCTSTDLT